MRVIDALAASTEQELPLLAVDEEDVKNLRTALRQGLQHRHYGQAVRLEVSASCAESLASFLLAQFNLPPRYLKSICTSVSWPAWLLGRDYVDKHPQDGAAILREERYPEELIESVLSHAEHLELPPGESFTIEYVTGKHFIHGQAVGLGLYVGSELQENAAEETLAGLHRVGVDMMCWESDYPHSDSTWPHTKKVATISANGDTARLAVALGQCGGGAVGNQLQMPGVR